MVRMLREDVVNTKTHFRGLKVCVNIRLRFPSQGYQVNFTSQGFSPKKQSSVCPPSAPLHHPHFAVKAAYSVSLIGSTLPCLRFDGNVFLSLAVQPLLLSGSALSYGL